MFFNILYNIVIYPIEFILEILFYLFNNVFRSSYSVSLFLLSLSVNFLSLPLYNIAESWQAKERAIQDKMKPVINSIKLAYKGDQRYLLIRACQRINGYKMIYAFRGTLGLLIQIPFFIAAYNFIQSLPGLPLGSFLFIKDFSKPDSLLRLGNLSINVLPFVMTLFSLLAGLVYSKKLKFKESLPLYIVSLIFLVLLYNSPSGLLFYWTINCLFSFVKNIIIEYKLYNVFVVNRYRLLKIYNIFFVIFAFVIILLIILGNVERKGYLSEFSYSNNSGASFGGTDGYYYYYHFKLGYYSKIFRHSDFYGVTINMNKINTDLVKNIVFDSLGSPFGNVILTDSSDNIGKIEVYYKLYVKGIFSNSLLILSILFLLFNFSKIYNFIFINNEVVLSFYLKNRIRLLLSSCLTIALLSGLFIPSSLASSSPLEFKYVNDLIFNNLSISLGIFLFYPLFLYILFSDNIKNIITIMFSVLCLIVLFNVFIMVGDYGNITSDFIFDELEAIIANNMQIIINILLILLSFVIIILLIKYKANILLNIFYVLVLVLFSVSVYNIYNILKERNRVFINNNSKKKDREYDHKMFKLSKTGTNVFVILSDTAMGYLWMDAFERDPEYKKKLDGFVFYPNNVSMAPNTVGSAASLYGGYEYLPYEISTNGNYYITNVIKESILTVPLSLEKYNYESHLLSMPFFDYLDMYSTNYKNIYYSDPNKEDYLYKYAIEKYLGISSEDLEKNESKLQTSKAIRFSIFRMLPIWLRYRFYNNAGWYIVKSDNISFNMKYYYMLLATKDFVAIEEDGNYYNALHNYTTHAPATFNSKYLPTKNFEQVNNDDLLIYHNDANAVRFYYANVGALNCVVDFIEFLKDNNIYDNTKIIVIADHGRGIVQNVFPKNSMGSSVNALLMYKDFNSSGEIKIDTNFSTIADMPYLATKHISGIKNYFTGNLITNDYKTNGAYIIHSDWFIETLFSNRYTFNVFYHVKDNIFISNNWNSFKMNWKTKEIEKLN